MTDWVTADRSKTRPGWCDYILGRGFKPHTLSTWGIGFSESYDRISIPVMDVHGSLTGFKGRAWRDEQKPKYLVLSGNGREEWGRYQVSRVVFGLERIPMEWDEIILVEGELNVIALWQMGIFNAVAVNGSNFSDRQAQLIKSNAEKVIVYFDSDSAGIDGTNLVCQKLRDYLDVYVTEDHEGDAGDAIDLDPEKSHITEKSVRSLLDTAVSETRVRVALRTGSW